MGKQIYVAMVVGVLALGAAAVSGCSTAHECGDGVCSGGENPNSCASDCTCGNGFLDDNEECDGTDLGGASCTSLGLDPGPLTCSSSCSYELAECGTSVCGNGEVEAGEDCEPGMLDGQSCTSLGFAMGDLACNSSCQWDFSLCCNDQCAGANDSQCSDDTIQNCVAHPSGCMVWEDGTDCAATGEFCTEDGGDASCGCVDKCLDGASRCESGIAEECQTVANGCLDWVSTMNCGDTGDTCAVGPDGPVCAPAVSGNDCSAPYPIHEGVNVIAHSATTLDYMTDPPCGYSGVTAPDVVMEYTANITGALELTMAKPSSSDFTIIATDTTCGDVSAPLVCDGTYSPDYLTGDFPVTAGQTYYFYFVDAWDYSVPMPNPLILEVTEYDCTGFGATASNPAPAMGAVTTTLRPELSIDFDTAVSTNSGTITLTGDMGTAITYDLAAAPSEVSWSNADRTLTITPAGTFGPGENITVTWTLVDGRCGNDIAQPAWTFEVIDPPCAPGFDGVVGSNVSRSASSATVLSQYYMATTPGTGGWVYVGDTTELERFDKSTGATEDLVTAASLTSSHLGYTMLVSGDNVFTVDDSAAQTGVLWRITSDGGANWAATDYASFPSTPNSNVRGITEADGKIWMITFSSTVPQIWSIDPNAATLPAVPTLEGTVTGSPGTCSGLSLDDSFFYTACDGNDSIVRIDRSTYAAEVIHTGFDMSLTVNHVFAQDTDSDNKANVLYVKGWTDEVFYVCDPGGTTPYVDLLSNAIPDSYGMAFDPQMNRLLTFDDGTDELVYLE